MSLLAPRRESLSTASISRVTRMGDKFSLPVRPRNAGDMFRYKLHWADGSEAGDASYAINIKPGDLIWIQSPNRHCASSSSYQSKSRTRPTRGYSR
jgi:hypothetical protein